eukprot:m.457023 g.457023  ORF g.457023 m.457023 type:complete len:234 (+) comp20328_c2_seq4:848-1549(+)
MTVVCQPFWLATFIILVGTMADAKLPFPELPYAYDALAPVLSEEAMRLHHLGHHKAYHTKLLAALEKFDKRDTLTLTAIDNLVSDPKSVPEELQTAVLRSGLQFLNHYEYFWSLRAPGTGPAEPTGKLAAALAASFGSVAEFKDAFSSSAKSVFGSGWVWLVDNGGTLSLETSKDHERPASGRRLLCLDVWEHAYYPDYKNKRAAFIEAWWTIVDWSVVQERFEATTAAHAEL